MWDWAWISPGIGKTLAPSFRLTMLSVRLAPHLAGCNRPPGNFYFVRHPISLAPRANDAGRLAIATSLAMSQNRSASAAQNVSPPPPGSTAAPASRSVRLPGEDLSLNEMLRVMDVAREMRRNRTVAEEMFRRDEVRTELRSKLMRSAVLAGDRVTEAEVDAAIDHYLQNLHTYNDPPSSFKRKLAHAWVWRKRIAAGTAAAAITIGGVWYLFLSPIAVLSPAVRAERAVAAEQATAQRLVEQIRALANDPAIVDQAVALQRQIDASGTTAGEVTAAIAAKNELATMADKLAQAFEVHIVSRDGAQSAIERGKDDLDSVFYVIVEARDATGNVLPQSIRNAETGRVETVISWAEQVPEAVYRRLAADKRQDGMLSETLFATKSRGTLEPTIQIAGPGGSPISPGNRLTDWK